MDIMCTVWIAVHNKSMEIKPKNKFTTKWYLGGPTTELKTQAACG
jgi:hypothetical protein